jgi:FMN phosphatase YigB (HAD superfamily)
MPDVLEIDWVFFDIGGTLGDRNNSGQLVAFPSSAGLLKAMREEIGLHVGIITTLGTQLTNQQALTLLRDAGLGDFIDAQGFVSDRDANASKPDARIYRFAADRVNVPISRCLYVGENLIEVIGAMAAGMKAVLKPCPPGRDLPI